MYRVSEHGRSAKYAIKNVVEDGGSVLLSSAACLGLYATLVTRLGVGG